MTSRMNIVVPPCSEDWVGRVARYGRQLVRPVSTDVTKAQELIGGTGKSGLRGDFCDRLDRLRYLIGPDKRDLMARFFENSEICVRQRCGQADRILRRRHDQV